MVMEPVSRSMKIPFHKVHTGDEEINAVTEVIKNGWLTMGPKTFAFERAFSDYTGARNSIAVNSCTAALHLSLVAAGVCAGDEVIIPAMTFVATAEVLAYIGAIPVLCDVKKSDVTIDPDKIISCITPRTKAVIPVHYGGSVCDMDSIFHIAQKHNLTIIEDAAHALPSYYKNRMVGTIGHYTCFSFYATKTLSTGEGGMITTDDDYAAERIRILRLHGISREAWNRYAEGGQWAYDVLETGYKYNMTDTQAALGSVQLQKQDKLCEKRENIAAKYDYVFHASSYFLPYKVPDYVRSAHHLYILRLAEDSGLDRDMFINELRNAGIGTSVHYIPLYRFTAFSGYNLSPADFPVSEWIFKRSLSLPIFPDMTDDEIEYVAATAVQTAEKLSGSRI